MSPPLESCRRQPKDFVVAAQTRKESEQATLLTSLTSSTVADLPKRSSHFTIRPDPSGNANFTSPLLCFEKSTKRLKKNQWVRVWALDRGPLYGQVRLGQTEAARNYGTFCGRV